MFSKDFFGTFSFDDGASFTCQSCHTALMLFAHAEVKKKLSVFFKAVCFQYPEGENTFRNVT